MILYNLAINENKELLNELKTYFITEEHLNSLKNMAYRLNAAICEELTQSSEPGQLISPLYTRDTISFTYMKPVIDIINSTNSEPSSIVKEICSVVLLTVNKIILDNLYSDVKSNKVTTRLLSINTNNGINTSSFLIKSNYIKTIKDQLLHNSIQYLDQPDKYIDEYLRHTIKVIYSMSYRFINPILIKLLNSLYELASHLNYRYWIFELDPYYRPMLILWDIPSEASTIGSKLDMTSTRDGYYA